MLLPCLLRSPTLTPITFRTTYTCHCHTYLPSIPFHYISSSLCLGQNLPYHTYLSPCLLHITAPFCGPHYMFLILFVPAACTYIIPVLCHYCVTFTDLHQLGHIALPTGLVAFVLHGVVPLLHCCS